MLKIYYVFFLLSLGVSVGHISRILGLCTKSIYKNRQILNFGNIKNLLVLKSRGRTSKLSYIEQDIINEININNYHSLQQIVDMIFEKFKIKTSLSAVGRLLKKHDIKRYKAGSIPAKADPEK